VSVLDAIVSVGVESTYGTPVAPTRSFEAQADPINTRKEMLTSVGIRSGMEATLSGRARMINMGGDGSLEFDVLTKGAGMILKGLLGGSAGPTQQAATIAYLQTYTSVPDGPTQSWTIQVVRPYVATDTVQQFTAHGCMATGWTLSQSNDGFAKLSVDFDAEDVDISTAAAAATYPASAVPFDWTQCAVSIGGSAFEPVTSFEVTADLAMKTDRRYLRNSALKKQPVRQAVPAYSGSLQADWDTITRYNEFVAGTVVTNLIVTWTGALIASTYYDTLKVIIPAVMWTGEDPKASITEVSTQALPFVALDDLTNPVMTIEYTSTDSAI
jgi:hypothetical protein